MKIAICLSGQPRSIEFATASILNYFSNSEFTCDYFCHSWDYNTWKCRDANGIFKTDDETVDVQWLETMIQRFNPIKYKIQDRNVIYHHKKWYNMPWASMLYSGMAATHMKKEYEMEHDFVYDCVVRLRYDVIFPPDSRFNIHPSRLQERTLYHTTQFRMSSEYNLLNTNDVFFYGDSWGMDIAGDTFRNVDRNWPARIDDMPINGPGTLISDYCIPMNVEHRVDFYNKHEIVLRKEMCHKDIIADFQEIKNFHRSYYE